MPHIPLTDGVPGIRSAFQFSPETARPMLALAEALLRGESTLTRAEREMLAARVSRLNGCHFCEASHRAAAAHHLGGDYTVVDAVLTAPAAAPISPKFRALLDIAALVVAGGLKVGEADVAAARHEGATDREIHDTVLIAAAFCMYNRYVDGLATWAPDDPDFYRARAAVIAINGYVAATPSPAAPPASS